MTGLDERPTSQAGRPPVRAAMVLLGILLLAVNLRAGLSAYPPLLETVRDALGISAGAAGLVQSSALVMMGVGSFVAPWLGHRLGWERALGASVGVVALGSLLRIVPALWSLLAGSLLVGLGIGLAGVLLAGVVKHHMADRAGTVTGAYSVSMLIGATVSGAAAVPLAVGLGGWSVSMAVWAAPAALATGLWWPLARRFRRTTEERSAGSRLPWRNRFALLATLYMAMSSSQFYGWLTWLSPYYEALGWTNQRAALLQALWTIVQLPVAFVVSALAERRRRWVFWVSSTLICGLVGLVGALVFPQPPIIGAWGWVVLNGIGAGASFALGLSIISWRSRDAASAGAVTGLALGIGYLTAAAAPLVMGLLLDLTGGFKVPLGLLVAAALLQLLATVLIGNPPRSVPDEPAAPPCC
ncbi:MFS transporter [Pseudonocardia spinosispora]|uniref:MFS transporter n=1 Tax=Pseudonocardia spinosispora TaxID=103441 RepID=UPI001FE07E7D|nr:MFS transporter [Pseudonocardia spinosispora]